MSEPASAILRRMGYQAAPGCLCGLPTCPACADESEAKRVLRNALPALADLVEATESEHALRHGVPGGQKDVGQCFHQCCRALAALRERLAVKP